METLTIQNFKYGLDTRREQLISLPGTLITCQDGHITQGGEIAKRKAFVQTADCGMLDGNGDTGTFGIQRTQVGLFVFGSALPRTSGLVGYYGQGAYPRLVTDIPVAVKYAIAFHPAMDMENMLVYYPDAVVGGTAYDRTKHRVTSIVWSTSFNGKPFFCAKFADGLYALFYDYDLVSTDTVIPYYYSRRVAQSTDGIIFTQGTAAFLVDDVMRIFQGYKATVPPSHGDARFPDWVADNSLIASGQVIVKSPAGVSFGLVPTLSNTARRIGFSNIGSGDSGITGTPARFGFTITAAATGDHITIAVPGDKNSTTAINLLSSWALPTIASTTAAATAIVNAINEFTSSHGYYAYQSANTFAIYSPPDWGNFTGTITWTLTGTLTFTTGATVAGPLNAVLTSLNISGASDNNHFSVQSENAQLRIYGGSGNYTVTWEAVDNPHGINIGNKASATTNFGLILPFANTQIVGTFRAKILDSSTGGSSTFSPTLVVTLTRGKVTST